LATRFALECARNYAEREVADPRKPTARKRGVNRSTRQKISARGQIPQQNRLERTSRQIHKGIVMSSNKLKTKVDTLPEAPGVYLFKDNSGKIIYIGKAKSLKRRVQSYFTRYLSTKTQALVSRIAGIEHMLSPTEMQAALLEAILIKEKQPQYNISLKDDKSFPLIKITGEEYPLITICRQKEVKKQDNCVYLGPYVNAKLLRQALKVIRKIFGFRSCKKMPKHPCLYYRLKQCPAPCAKKISAQEYREIVKDIRLFLESRYEKLVDKLSSDMKAKSSQQKFEEAAKIRDQINALASIGENKKHFTSSDETEDLKNLIGLDRLPLRIEGFDISNISGKEASGAMVSFYRGLPDKNNYRRFRIKTVQKIDDCQMLREVVHRRYFRLIKENSTLPDLVLIDGGRQHLLAAEKELKKINLDLPVASIAKEEEHIYIIGRNTPIKLSVDTPALNLIRRVRDEAHRFARKYHHLLRKKKMIGE
jgi:excinuclease ABC subunit C